MKAGDKKAAEKYLKKARLLSIFLQWAPFLRCIILNGSLAAGTAKESSDIDILIIARRGRIYTVRFCVNSFAAILGIKRSNDNKSHAGKFCFNYFLTDNFLTVPIRRGRKVDRYCADNYSRSVLVWGKQTVFDRFMEENEELFRKATTDDRRPAYRRGKPPTEVALPMKIFHPVFVIGRILEFFLNGWLGKRMENVLKRYQIRKIEKDERTKKYPDFIVYSDRELRFHPPKRVN